MRLFTKARDSEALRRLSPVRVTDIEQRGGLFQGLPRSGVLLNLLQSPNPFVGKRVKVRPAFVNWALYEGSPHSCTGLRGTFIYGTVHTLAEVGDGLPYVLKTLLL